MIDRRHSYVLALDEHIPNFCADCEGPLPEAGRSGVWLFRMSISEHGQFRVDALCPECGMKHAPVLTAALAAAWREHHALYEVSNAH